MLTEHELFLDNLIRHMTSEQRLHIGNLKKPITTRNSFAKKQITASKCPKFQKNFGTEFVRQGSKHYQPLNAANDNSAHLQKQLLREKQHSECKSTFRNIYDWLMKEIKHDWTSKYNFKKLKMRKRAAHDGERQP